MCTLLELHRWSGQIESTLLLALPGAWAEHRLKAFVYNRYRGWVLLYSYPVPKTFQAITNVLNRPEPVPDNIGGVVDDDPNVGV